MPPLFYVDRNSEHPNSSIIAQDNKPAVLKMGDRDGLPSIHDPRYPGSPELSKFFLLKTFGQNTKVRMGLEQEHDPYSKLTTGNLRYLDVPANIRSTFEASQLQSEKAILRLFEPIPAREETLYVGSGAAGSPYGAAGSLITLLLWICSAAQIVLFGAEFTQVYTNTYGSHIEPEEHAVWVEGTEIEVPTVRQ